MAEKRVKLGMKARDVITNFEGIVICVAEWLNGCARISIQPMGTKDGKVLEFDTFDEQQIEIIDNDRISLPEKQTTPPGGPRPKPSNGMS